MKVLTINKKILDYLNKKEKGRIKSMCEELEINRSSGHAIITRLKREKLVTRIEHGLYTLTEQGKIEADKLSEDKIQNSISKSQNKDVDIGTKAMNNDIDDVDTIIEMKKKYGREELVKRLKKMIQILE